MESSFLLYRCGCWGSERSLHAQGVSQFSQISQFVWRTQNLVQTLRDTVNLKEQCWVTTSQVKSDTQSKTASHCSLPVESWIPLPPFSYKGWRVYGVLTTEIVIWAFGIPSAYWGLIMWFLQDWSSDPIIPAPYRVRLPLWAIRSSRSQNWLQHPKPPSSVTLLGSPVARFPR